MKANKHYMETVTRFLQNKTKETTEELFALPDVQRIIRNGTPYKWYDTYGITELKPVYEKYSMDEYFARVLEETKELTFKTFKAEKVTDVSNVTDLRKIINRFLGFTVKEAVRCAVVKMANESLFPNLTRYYLSQYVKIRKYGLTIGEDSNERIIQVFLDNNKRIAEKTINGIRMAFNQITPERFKEISSVSYRKENQKPRAISLGQVEPKALKPARRKIAYCKVREFSERQKNIVSRMEDAGYSFYQSRRMLLKKKDLPISEKELDEIRKLIMEISYAV